MDILIKNIEIPQEGHIEAYIWCNGTVTYRKKIDNQWDRNSTTAVALPEHGDLIDRNKLPIIGITDYKLESHTVVEFEDVLNAPVIVEATE